MNGPVAEWLCSGLQIRVRGFDSLSDLHFKTSPDKFQILPVMNTTYCRNLTIKHSQKFTKKHYIIAIHLACNQRRCYKPAAEMLRVNDNFDPR